MTVARRFYFFRIVAALGFVMSGAARATAAPTTNPSSDTKTFQNTKAGIRFEYPVDWTSTKAPTALFDVVDPAKSDGSASLCLDVPGLPPAIFCGLITPKMVENGYVKDLKKNQIHDANVDESVALTVPASSARRVKCSGHEDGKVAIDVAVLIVHANRVYIFSCDSDEAGYPKARAALDAAVASMEWIK
jgi:hypothetical protein